MDLRHRPPSRVERGDHELLPDDDERALEAIRRQLDMEFAHSTEPVAVTAPAAPRRRVPSATVVGVLLACVSGGAAAILLTPLYQALQAHSTVEREAPPAAPAALTRPVAAARPTPATAPAPPQARAQVTTEPASRRPATRAPEPPVPDVIRVSAAAPASTEPPAVAAAPPRIVVAPSVQHGASATTAATTSSPPLESAAAARAPLPLGQLASEHVRAAWGSVKERVARGTGELAEVPRSGPEAP